MHHQFLLHQILYLLMVSDMQQPIVTCGDNLVILVGVDSFTDGKVAIRLIRLLTTPFRTLNVHFDCVIYRVIIMLNY